MDYRKVLGRNVQLLLDAEGATRETIKAHYLAGTKKGKKTATRTPTRGTFDPLDTADDDDETPDDSSTLHPHSKLNTRLQTVCRPLNG
jgi:hypothetical protein